MMGHNGSKRSPVARTEGDAMRDLEKADSLEVDKSSVGGDEDLGGGGLTLPAKKRKDERDSAFENGSAAKRVLRSDSVNWHVDAETAGGAAVNVRKGDCLEKTHCEAIAEPDASGTLTFDACNGEKDREMVDVKVSGTVEEAAMCSEINADVFLVASVMEVIEGNGLHTQGSTLESGDKRKKEDEKVHPTTTDELNESVAQTSGGSIGDLQANKGCNGPCKGEVIDASSTANDGELIMGLSRSNPTSGPESIEQEDAVVSTEGVVLLSGDQKVEKHCCIDDVHKETEVSLVENGICTIDKHNALTDCTNQEGMGSPLNESKEVSAADIVFIRRKSITRKTSETKQVKCEEEVRFEKRVTRSATVRQREVSGSTCKSSQNEANMDGKVGKEDILHHYTRKVSGTVSSKAHHPELEECGTNSKKQMPKGKVTARRNSDVTSNNDPASMTEPEVSETEVKLNLKSQSLTRNGSIVKKTTEDAVSAVDQNLSSSAITERNDTEITDSEGVKSENKIAMQKSILSVGAKIVASKKRIMESSLDKICGGSPVMMPSMKKTRSTPSDTELDQPNKSSGKELMGNNCGSDKREIFMKRQHRSQAAELSRSVKRSNKKACKLSDNESDDDRTDSDTSNMKSYRVRTRGSASVVLKKQDSSESEEVIIVKKDRQKERDSGQKQRAGSTSKHYSGSSKPTRLERAILVNSDSRSSSKQAEKRKMKVPKGKRKENKASSAKSSSPSEPINTGSLREEKQKISEQIKGILLDAGWKIDLRPRNGRNYLDSVYIPPSGKGSYWSVTKAYSVYLENMESEQKDRTKRQSSSKKSVGSPDKRHASAGCSLPEEILSKLKRMVVNKRRTKVELQKLRKKKHSLLKKFKNSKRKSKDKKNKTSNSRKLHLGSERRKRGGCALLARGSNQEAGSSTGGFVPYEWKRTVFSWLIDLDILSANAGLKCMDETRSEVLLEGVVTRDGINCSCCSKIFALLEFVAHAGGQVSKPYRSVLVDGLDIDLLHCLINAWDKQSDSERQAFFPISTEGDDPNDDTCGICGDGGNLICCDGCPSTFHMSCLDLEALPSDDWRCANCSCKFCQEHSSHDAQDIAEVDSSLRTCSQCEEKYHPACSPDIDNTSSVSNQAINSFCQQSCRLLFEELQNLLAVKKDLEPEFSCRIIQRIHEDVPEAVLAWDERIECNSKIAVAFSLMDECFVPIVDQRTGINLIRNVVYNCGSNFGRLDFRGFYIFILERGDEIISAASVRIHGTKLAEMPFIGTRNMYRHQGMCRRLLDGIEMILSYLKVEKLIIPAINELVDTWTSKFGFSTLEDSHKKEVKSTSLLVFPGTGLLQKPLLKKALPEEDPSSEEAGAVFPGDKCDKASQVANEDSLYSIPNAETQSSQVTDNLDSCKDAGACND